MRVPLAGLVVVTALVAVGASSGGEHGPTLADGHPCPGAATFTCSTLSVPLDHSGKAAGTLRLQVAQADGKKPKGVLLVLSGGPGQPGVSLVPRIARRLAPVLDDYRLVMFDQRGTGANALACAALQAQMGASDLRPPTRRAVESCGATIGPQRRFYTTRDTVADLELLRRALGVDKWVVDGISYGSYVAARYGLAHPRQAAKVVLDSVVPHDGIDMLGLASMPATARVLRAACAAAACGTDPAADLARTVRRFGNGAELLDAIVLMSIVDPTFVRNANIPGLLHLSAAGDRSILDPLLEGVRVGSSAPAGALSQGLHASTLCEDLEAPWGTSATPVARRMPAVRRAVAALRDRDVWPFDRSTARRNGFLLTCLYWPVTPAVPQPRRGVKLSVPTLLLNGDRDLSTPLVWARHQASLTPRGQLVVVAGAGHSVQTRDASGAGIRALARFLGS